ncbi:hypothetical protein V8D89_000499 [Ganoderma adspersum]
MRLLNTETGHFEEFVNADVVRYAILSHTWDTKGEQTYQEVREIQKQYGRDGRRLHDSSPGDTSSIWDNCDLSEKIRNACVVARAHGFRYIWIDSCCIDKTSSSELSEAINSMFTWYRKATICYAFLADVPGNDIHERFSQSRWFTRGWTLQELIAPRHLVFLTSEWKTMGTKTTLAFEVEKITGIDYLVLVDKQSLDDVGVARRMSWASKRQTTRVEDEAYSLLGIFNIKMPTVYGEGRGAFRRLQEEIMRRIPDQSIFALGGILPLTVPLLSSDIDVDSEHPEDPDGFMANSPRDFHLSSLIRPVPLDEFRRRCGNVSNLPLVGFTSTPYGICVQFPMVPFCESIDPHYIMRLPHSIRRLPYLWLILLACEHAAQPGCLLARVCMLKGSVSAPDLSCVYSVCVMHKGSGSARPYTILPWSPSRNAQLNPRPTLHIQPVYIRHVDTSDWSSRPQVQAHGTGRPRAFPVDLNMSLAPWAADALRGEGFTVHLCRWMSPAGYPIHRLVLSFPGYAAFELVFYLSVDRECAFLRFIASSMDEDGRGFGFEDHAEQSVTELNTSLNNQLNYDLDGPDIFLNTMAGDEMMVRLTVEEPERPLEGGFTHYLFVELMRTGRKCRRRDGVLETYHIHFGFV